MATHTPLSCGLIDLCKSTPSPCTVVWRSPPRYAAPTSHQAWRWYDGTATRRTIGCPVSIPSYLLVAVICERSDRAAPVSLVFTSRKPPASNRVDALIARNTDTHQLPGHTIQTDRSSKPDGLPSPARSLLSITRKLATSITATPSEDREDSTHGEGERQRAG